MLQDKIVYSLGLCFLVCFISVGCTRPDAELKSKISISIPKSEGPISQGATIPADKKACYGVKVSGPGISPMPQTCGADLGIYGGFVEEGGVLSLDVPKGDSRTFDLVIYLAGAGEPCPAWTQSFGAYTGQLKSTYLAGRTEGVSLKNADETVAIALNFPGVGSDLATAQGLVGCINRLKGRIFSNGDVLDSAGNLLAGSSPVNEYFFWSPMSDIYGIGFITSGGLLNLGSGAPLEIPPFVYSVTRKPDNGVMYGLIGDGQIVSLSPSGSVALVNELSGANCPFAVDNCHVPAWMQSISAGFGSELFSLDQGGNIYQLGFGGTVTSTGDQVEPSVTHVSYY